MKRLTTILAGCFLMFSCGTKKEHSDPGENADQKLRTDTNKKADPKKYFNPEMEKFRTMDLELLKEFAEKENFYAVNELCDRYVGTDWHANARHWFKKLADKNSIEGIESLALLYEDGFSPFFNMDSALFWFEKAAEIEKAFKVRISNTGMSYLKDIYENGRPTLGFSKKQSQKWFKNAAAKGDTIAKQVLKECR